MRWAVRMPTSADNLRYRLGQRQDQRLVRAFHVLEEQSPCEPAALGAFGGGESHQVWPCHRQRGQQSLEDLEEVCELARKVIR